ncbi:MAG: hypothetical protein ABSC23_03830 [Bryobacteraceae bacterium]|jgi:hypothetical protein
MREPKAALGLLAVLLSACNGVPPAVHSNEQANSSASPEAPVPPKTPCPVNLIHPRMVHNLEMDVYATIVNVSTVDITAIAFGAAHTDKFGDMWEPYKTDLTSEDTIKKGRSLAMHWEVLMETPTGIKNSTPGSSELFVNKVALSDGRVLHIGDLDGCSFKF